MEKTVSIISALVGVALVAVIVQSANTSNVIRAGGDAFSNSVRAVMGNVANKR
jgi:membrane protein involved in colicin uptake